MAAQFATVEDYFRFLGKAVPTTLPDAERLRIDALLLRASDRIRREVKLRNHLVRYGADEFPTTSKYRAAFARATAAQAAAFEETGDATGVGAANDYDSVSLIGVSFSKRSGSSSGSTPDSLRAAPEALDILLGADVFTTRVSY